MRKLCFALPVFAMVAAFSTPSFALIYNCYDVIGSACFPNPFYPIKYCALPGIPKPIYTCTCEIPSFTWQCSLEPI
jgi:hypothetical protein